MQVTPEKYCRLVNDEGGLAIIGENTIATNIPTRINFHFGASTLVADPGFFYQIYFKILNPDPNWTRILDPDPNSMYLDPQHCFCITAGNIFQRRFSTRTL